MEYTKPVTILNQAIALKPSGTVEGVMNTLADQKTALENLSGRLTRREDKLRTFASSLAAVRSDCNTEKLSSLVTPLLQTVEDIKIFLQPALQRITELDTRVKEQNDSLQEAIKDFVSLNRESLGSANIPKKLDPAQDYVGLA